MSTAPSRHLIAALLSLAATHAALGVTWNGLDHPERGVTSDLGLTDKPGDFANVQVVYNGYNSTRGTATYLANGWIITARHVTQGSGYGNQAPATSMNFYNGANNYGALTIDMPNSVELSLVKLQNGTGLTELPSSVIYSGSTETNSIVQMGGYGLYGWIDGTTNSATAFHRAYNICWTSGGFIYTQLDGETRLSNLGLLEGGGMSGDSGSALWVLNGPDTAVNDWSQYQLAGILATSGGNAWGSQSQFSRVTGYSQLIKDVVWGSSRSYKWARGIAGTFSWNNSTLNGDLTNGNNWNSTLAPTYPKSPGDKANVGASAGANNQVIDLDENITVGELDIGSTNNGSGIQTVAAGGAFALTFNNLSAQGILIHNIGGRADVVSCPIILAGQGDLLIANPTAYALTLSGSLTSGLSSGTQTLTSSSGAVVLSGPISNGATGGAIALSAVGGTLTLSGANTYTGVTTVGSGSSVTATTLVALQPANLPGYATPGGVVVNAATLQIGAGGAGWTSAALSSLLSTGTFNAGAVLSVDAAAGSATTISSSFNNGLGLTKLDTGSLTLAGTQTYAGNLLLKGGAVAITGTVVANTWNSVGVNAGDAATLTVGGSFTAGADFNIGDTGSSSVAATGTLNLQPGGSVTIASGGGLFVGSGFTAGTMASGTINQSGGTLTDNGSADGAFILGGRNSAATTGTYNLSGGVVNANTNLQIGGRGAGSLTQTGGAFNAAGYVSIGRYAGATGLLAITGGTFNHNSLSTTILVGESGAGTLSLGGSADLNDTGGIELGANGGSSGVLALNGGTLTTPRIFQGAGTGAIRFNGGTLQAAAGSSTFLQGLGSAVIQYAPAVIDTQAFNITIAQPLGHDPTLGPAPDGGLVKNGPGTLTLSGPANYSGPTTLNGGQLLFTSAAHSVGAVAGAGTLHIAAGSSLTSDGVTAGAWLIDGAHVIRSSTTTLGSSKVSTLVLAGTTDAWTGSLDLTNNALILQTPGDPDKAAALSTLQNQLINGAAGAGGITSSTTAADPGHKTTLAIDNALLGLTQFAGQAVDVNSLLVESTWKGDANLDRKVDVIDLGVLATNYGQTVSGGITKGDYNNDGKVDVIDLGILATDYGLGTGGGGFSLQQQLLAFPQLSPQSSAPSPSPVPEPASLALLALGGAALLSRGGRRGRRDRSGQRGPTA